MRLVKFSLGVEVYGFGRLFWNIIVEIDIALCGLEEHFIFWHQSWLEQI